MYSSVLLLGAECAHEVSRLALWLSVHRTPAISYVQQWRHTRIFLLNLFFIDLLDASKIGSCQRKLRRYLL
jgi:hypothetical protein